MGPLEDWTTPLTKHEFFLQETRDANACIRLTQLKHLMFGHCVIQISITSLVKVNSRAKLVVA